MVAAPNIGGSTVSTRFNTPVYDVETIIKVELLSSDRIGNHVIQHIRTQFNRYAGVSEVVNQMVC